MANRIFPLRIDFKKSHGSFFHDEKSGQEYLDLFSMYSSLPLGYNHPIFDQQYREIIAEISYLRMSNNAFESDYFEDYLKIIRPYLFSPHIHFSCTGALAVEAAIKTALDKKKSKNPIVISIEKSFHGVNGWGLITDSHGVTGSRMECFRYFIAQDNWPKLTLENAIRMVEADLTGEIAAVVVEPIQATSGDIYLNEKLIINLMEVCKQKDVCVIFDEIQTGFGATGSMWYYEQLGVIPDILVFGKKSQVCGICISDEYKGILESPFQKLDVTFDGELIDIVRSSYILKAFKKYKILDNVRIVSDYLRKSISNKVDRYRSKGCLAAFDLPCEDDRNSFQEEAFRNKILVNKAGETSIRLRPSLSATLDEIKLFSAFVDSRT